MGEGDGDMRVALVSGAAGGLGPATCERLGGSMHIVACDLDERRVADLEADLAATGISIEGRQLDVTASIRWTSWSPR